ncbi:MAG: CAP domain-containing protein, partial [Syntrophaceticus sp.]|nr:CAP domain-containing protein [Syntrophaceticus sp.]MDD4783087.1 CAP domain-containing protein [Syntrophaceticus sp.]
MRYSISVLLVGLLITLLPVTAFAATRYIHYQGSLSDQLLTRILQQVFPGDDIKIIRSEWKQQPQPEPEPQPEQEPTPEQGSEPKPEQEPTPEQGSEPQPEPEPAPKPEQDPQPEPTPQPKPEPQPQPDPQPQTEPEPAPSSVSQYEQQMVNLVNQERQQAGLKPLTVDNRLVNLARLKSQDMIN